MQPTTPTQPKQTSATLAKLTRPRLAQTLVRTRLYQLLDAKSARAIVWISGPGGSGKTTLVSRYLSDRELPCLWYQIDASDADLATFFHYLSLAVQPPASRQQKTLPVLTPDYLPGLLTFAQRFFEQFYLQCAQDTVLIFDNYQEVPAESLLHEVLRIACENLPEGFRIMVLSRNNPPATLARLRTYGRMHYVRREDLHFTPEEITELIRLRKPELASESTSAYSEQLHAYTQGWAAGLVLLLEQETKAQPLAPNLATQEVLFHYFAGEVFARAPEAAQSMLLKTALLPQLTAATVGTLSGIPTAGQILDELHRHNFFTTRREESEAVYEYHPLFRQFLLNRAANTLSSVEFTRLQRQAASILDHSGYAEEAMKLWWDAGEWQEMIRLLLAKAATLISQGRHQTLLTWLGWLPPKILADNGWLRYWQGMAIRPYNPADARGYLEQAYDKFKITDDVSGLYSCWAGIMETIYFEYRDITPADRWITEFDELLGRHPKFPSSIVEMRTYWAMLTLLHRQPQHPFLPVWSERVEQLLNGSEYGDQSLMLSAYLTTYFLWRGDAVKARTLLQRMVPRGRTPEVSPVVYLLWCGAVANYHSLMGDAEQCDKVVKEALKLADETGLHIWDFLHCSNMARCCLVTGDLDAAATWLSSMHNSLRAHTHISGGFYHHFLTNLTAQQGDWQQAIQYARTGLAMGREAGVPFLEAHCLIALARALLGQGDTLEWKTHLDIATTIAHGMGSRVLTYLCLETEASAAFRFGQESLGIHYLQKALALSREMDGAYYHLSGPKAGAAIYQHALVAGVEINHVRQMIRRRRLIPLVPATAPSHWPWPTRIYGLNGFSLECDGKPLVFRGKTPKKPLELLKLLVAYGGQLDTHWLARQLWPDAEGDAVRVDLNVTLMRLRKLLPMDDVLRLSENKLSLNPAYVWTDVGAFEYQVEACLQQLHAAADTSDINDKGNAILGLYRRELMQGEAETPWLIAARDRLHSKYLRVLKALGHYWEAQRNWVKAQELYGRVLENNTTEEEIYRHLMRCYVHAGYPAEAMQVYQRCRQRLFQVLGITPTRETEELYREILRTCGN